MGRRAVIGVRAWVWVVVLLWARAATAQSPYELRLITFDDVQPPAARLTVCWGGIGMDHEQRVYFAASDENDVTPDDTVILRYDTRSDRRELLGTLRGISEKEGNLAPGESIGKVHVAIQEHEGRMYFSSHDYHDIRSDYSDMYERRGGHFYAFDLGTDTFQDLSKADNYGVSVPYQGIIAMDVLRAQDKLAGFTFPIGDLLIYDLKKRRTTFYPGVPQYRRSNVSRYIWATRKGRVYFSYAVPDSPVWALDVETGTIRRTADSNVLSSGFLHGMVATRDGDTVYLLTNEGGNLYAFDVESERLEGLGSLLPPEEIAQGRQVYFVNGLVLSRDERKLYTLPSEYRYGDRHEGAFGLYEYDIATRQKRRLADFSLQLDGTITGSGVIDDRDRIYFGYHRQTTVGSRACLVQIAPGDGGH
ncbi:MAG: hypothetical protein AB1505_13295 [Candidatus Latescibacterota bacterium]